MKKVMIISYVFPPAGGAAVQRVVKFVKYLGRYGWQPIIVTPKNPPVPVMDESYQNDLFPGLEVHRLPTLETSLNVGNSSSYNIFGTSPTSRLLIRLRKLAQVFLFPDPHILWLPTALPRVKTLAKNSRAQAVLVSGPPFSSFLLGLAVSKSADIPLILDFRDDWSGFFTHAYEAHGGWLAATASKSLERILVNRASKVIGNTPSMTKRLAGLHGGDPAKYEWIPNGYDPDDFTFLKQNPKVFRQDKLELLYAGTVFESHPLDGLWAGLSLLKKEQLEKLKVTVVGRVVDGLVVDPSLPGLKVEVHPYESHQKVLRRMSLAGALVFTMADLPGLNRMAPGKLFEYLAVRQPVLAISPPGEGVKILEACHAGVWLHPRDSQSIADLISKWINERPATLPPPPAFFNRELLTARLARVLDQAIGQKITNH